MLSAFPIYKHQEQEQGAGTLYIDLLYVYILIMNVQSIVLKGYEDYTQIEQNLYDLIQ